MRFSLNLTTLGSFEGPSSQPTEQTVPETPSGTMPELPEDFDPSQMFGNGEMPDMSEMPDMNTLPNGMESGSGNRDIADAPGMSENILLGGTNTGGVDIGSAVMVLGICLAVLAVGLIVAFKFKR